MRSTRRQRALWARARRGRSGVSGGMRIKILEGMSYGKVIVSTSIGAEGISGESGKDFCIANTPQDYTNAIINLIKNKELCANLGENATIFVSTKFDNRQILANLLSFYCSRS